MKSSLANVSMFLFWSSLLEQRKRKSVPKEYLTKYACMLHVPPYTKTNMSPFRKHRIACLTTSSLFYGSADNLFAFVYWLHTLLNRFSVGNHFVTFSM